MKIDDETKELAALALRNAFWQDFSGLVNKYVAASADLGIRSQEAMLGELTSIYGRDQAARIDLDLNIWTQNGPGKFSNTGHDTLLEALQHAPATEVHLCGVKIFERRAGEWFFVGDKA